MQCPQNQQLSQLAPLELTCDTKQMCREEASFKKAGMTLTEGRGEQNS